MLALAWQYLRGRAVATDPTDRQRAEWPPHPDRVLQALVAAWGERGADETERETLDWLLTLPPPAVAVPLDVGAVTIVKSYVPVNDVERLTRAEYKPAQLGLLPDKRPRKQRFFPTTQVGDGVCALIWPDVAADSRAPVIATLCAAVTHVGHSSSLVRMWLSDSPPPAVLEPCADEADLMLRVSGPGRLDDLIRAHAGGGPGWRRPPWALWQAYREVRIADDVRRGEFSDRLIVLRRLEGAPLNLMHGPAVVQAMRGLLIAAADRHPLAKRLVSGHEPDGSMTRLTHVAILPLGFVTEPTATHGSRHADGHLMGIGLALPRLLDADEELEVLGVVARAFRPEGRRELTLGPLGAVSIAAEDRDEPPQTLQPHTWTRASRTWATVTPIALDRSAPRRHEDPEAWTRAQIADACSAQGLPRPIDVELGSVAHWIGVPPTRGFPPLLRKDGSRRWHTHARLTFASTVGGPLVLGAGRYRGYGLCKPQKP